VLSSWRLQPGRTHGPQIISAGVLSNPWPGEIHAKGASDSV